MSIQAQHSPADITAQVLIDLGLAGLPSASWPVFVGDLPDLPDNCIAVYDRAGVSDGRAMFNGERQVHEGVQILVRSADYQTGGLKAASIVRTLDEGVLDRGVTISSRSYLIHCYSRTGRVVAVGKEAPESRRDIFSLDTLVTITNRP